MDDKYKKEIEKHAKDYFKDLHLGMPPSMIARTISFFEFHLSKEEFFHDLDDDVICHSDLLKVPFSLMVDIQDLALGISRIYGNKAVKFIQYDNEEKTTHYFSFVGYKADVHASLVSLKKLMNMTKQARTEYAKTLSKRFKPENKKKKVDDFIYGWVEDLFNNLSPTALTGDDYTEYDKYVDETFTKHSEFTKYIEDAQSFFEIIANNPEVTGKEALDMFEAKHGYSIQKVSEKREKLSNIPLLQEWSSYW